MQKQDSIASRAPIPAERVAPGKIPPATLEMARLIVLVAELKSISGAARAMGIDASLATRRVAQVEKVFGVRLFERTTRAIKLTEGGLIALNWARASLDVLERTTDELSALQQQPAGLIRLAVAPQLATYALPPLLAQFCRRYPKIRFSMTVTDSQVRLVEDQFDIAIHSARVQNSSMIGQCLRKFDRILCATPEYLERKGIPLQPGDLSNHDCLRHSLNESRHWSFKQNGAVVSQVVAGTVEADSYSVLLELARQSMGIARLARNLVEQDIAEKRLVQVMPSYTCAYPNGERPGLWILYPNRRVLNRSRLFIDYLIREFGEGPAMDLVYPDQLPAS